MGSGNHGTGEATAVDGCEFVDLVPSRMPSSQPDAASPSSGSENPDAILSTSELSSVGEELCLDAPLAGDEFGAKLDVDAVLRFFSVDRPDWFFGSPMQQAMARIAGTGLGFWEIHRPQMFVRQLVMGQREAFAGRVLDSGCGIGDNALYIAKACPGAARVVAVDLVPRCLEFCKAKARLRGMMGRVTFVAADMTQYDSLPEEHRAEPYDVVLDSSLFHMFTDEERERYADTLQLLLRPGGMLFLHAVSEEETRQGGPRRVRLTDVELVFRPARGWQLEAVEPSPLELHPSFWGGQGRARLYTIRRTMDAAGAAAPQR